MAQPRNAIFALATKTNRTARCCFCFGDTRSFDRFVYQTSNTFRIIRAANHIAKDTFRTISVATVAQFGLIYVIAKRLLDRVVVAWRD